jgi:hypothetical protein
MRRERNYLVQVDGKEIVGGGGGRAIGLGLEGRSGRVEKGKAGWIIFISQ